MAERPILSGENRSGHSGGEPGEGRNRALPGSRQQVAGGNGSPEGRPGCDQAASPNAEEAPQHRAIPEAVPTPGAEVDSRQPNPASGPDGERGLVPLLPEPESAATPGQEPCPACGSPEFTRLFSSGDRLYETTRKQFQIVECRRCRLIRLFPQPSPAELARYYPEGYAYALEETVSGRIEAVYHRFALRNHLQFVRKALADSGDRSGLVLDVGCGGGLFLSVLAEQGCRVLGLDFCLDAGAIAWRRNGVPAVCASLSKAPFPAGSCSVITMFNVLEHLYDPVAHLEAARDLLQPEGRLIIQVPNAASWQFLLLGENWSGVDVPRHLLIFRPRDLDVLLDHCGFTVVRRKFFSLRDNPSGFATSLAPRLDPRARCIRRVQETPNMKLLKDALYYALVLIGLPLTMLEAACRAGSTTFVEARKKT